MSTTKNVLTNYFENEFADLDVKRTNLFYFALFIIWTQNINMGRVLLQRALYFQFGVYVDSNLVSRSQKVLQISNAPRRRVEELKLVLRSKPSLKHTSDSLDGNQSSSVLTDDENKKLEIQVNNTSASQLLMKSTASHNIDEFNNLEQKEQDNLIETMTQMASGKTLYELQEENSRLSPYQTFKNLGEKVGNWLIRKVNHVDAVAIAIDEKIIKKAFDAAKYRNYSMYYVSRVKTYLPSLMVEVVGLIRPGRLAEIVGHNFPYPQKRILKGKRVPLRKDEYLIEFFSILHQYYGHLPLLADANYATQKLLTWLIKRNWAFVMRLNSRGLILKGLKKQLDDNPNKKFVQEWTYNEKYGGWIRIMAYRRSWTDAKGKYKQKRYFWITNLDWDSQDILALYRTRWCLENSFKALNILDRLPGLDSELIKGFFAMTLHVMAPLCFELRSSTKTLSRLMELLNKNMYLSKNEIGQIEMCWYKVPTRFARKLLLWAYYNPFLVKSISILL